jgi:hypothetical protein
LHFELQVGTGGAGNEAPSNITHTQDSVAAGRGAPNITHTQDIVAASGEESSNTPTQDGVLNISSQTAAVGTGGTALSGGEESSYTPTQDDVLNISSQTAAVGTGGTALSGGEESSNTPTQDGLSNISSQTAAVGTGGRAFSGGEESSNTLTQDIVINCVGRELCDLLGHVNGKFNETNVKVTNCCALSVGDNSTLNMRVSIPQTNVKVFEEQLNQFKSSSITATSTICPDSLKSNSNSDCK